MIFKKFEKISSGRLEPGVAAIAGKSVLSRARISDRRAGVPPGAYSKRTHKRALHDPYASARRRGNRERGRKRGSQARRPARRRRAGVIADA